MKKIISLILMLVFICAALSACNDNKVEYIEDNDNVRDNIMYQGKTYINTLNDGNYWHFDDEKLEKIDQHGILFYPEKFYSDQKDNPDFICSGKSGDVWFKKGYDYKAQDFSVLDTDIFIKFSDTYIEGEYMYSIPEENKLAEFQWAISDHKELKNSPAVYLYEEKYYIQFGSSAEAAFRMTEDFINLLKENKIIK